MYWVIIRSILDQCKTVNEAKEILRTIPIGQFASFIIMDKSDNAVLIEAADGETDLKDINIATEEKFLCATNHFKLPKTSKYNKFNCGIIANSEKRTALINATLENAKPKITL